MTGSSIEVIEYARFQDETIVDQTIVDVSVFDCDLSAFDQHSRFQALRDFFRSSPPLKSEGARTPMVLMVNSVL